MLRTLLPVPVDVIVPVPPLAVASGVVRVSTCAAIVPVNVGDALRTLLPEPVDVVTPVPPRRVVSIPVVPVSMLIVVNVWAALFPDDTKGNPSVAGSGFTAARVLSGRAYITP